MCINNNSDNTQSSNATISDSRLSVDRNGEINIPGSLVVNNTNILSAITDLQNNSGGSDSSTDLYVSSVKTIGSISSSSSEEQVEIGKSIVRISSLYASLRLETVGQSQHFTGFTITRNGITGYVFPTWHSVSFSNLLYRYPI